MDAVPVFRNMGGKEKVEVKYTAVGKVPFKVTSINPDGTEKIVREFNFNDIKRIGSDAEKANASRLNSNLDAETAVEAVKRGFMTASECIKRFPETIDTLKADGALSDEKITELRDTEWLEDAGIVKRGSDSVDKRTKAGKGYRKAIGAAK